MDVNVWLGGNNNIFSSVNKNIFSLSRLGWVAGIHGIQCTWLSNSGDKRCCVATPAAAALVQVAHWAVSIRCRARTFTLHHKLSFLYINSTTSYFASLKQSWSIQHSTDGGLCFVIHIMCPSKWNVKAWAAVSSELHCAESDRARVVTPVLWWSWC